MKSMLFFLICCYQMKCPDKLRINLPWFFLYTHYTCHNRWSKYQDLPWTTLYWCIDFTVLLVLGCIFKIFIFLGHTDGITFIDTKDDARHIITNSKDQSIKLWDLRKFSNNRCIEATRKAVRSQTWDYRWARFPGTYVNLNTSILIFVKFSTGLLILEICNF